LKIQLAQQKKQAWTEKSGKKMVIDKLKLNRLIGTLPFNLTASQNLALQEIITDLSGDQPMNRLLQGEVGSGKTVVAALAMYLSYLNGFKSILMVRRKFWPNSTSKPLNLSSPSREKLV
jgi:ATP-dependent DNA helicase RecG